jgi:hypothetical protein
MKIVLLGGLLIGLPAIVVVLLFWGSAVMLPALASLLVAALPFLAFAAFMRRGEGDADDADRH